ncbi:triphosphate tunnel metalloenzyme 3-like [Diospyros lotus]|uniref:triphosphate tunnel metalloenzyme 3-like n=1 Tax=Diospyros lotus TaxID=55363 RepID=UPI002250A3C1|nr:triphosphate tunnel metalloenzyme 3-like [Diospyros lotus]
MIRTLVNHSSLPARAPPPQSFLRRLLQKQGLMEVEVKLRLPDAASHQKLSDLLSPFRSKTLIQENVFFDGSNAELSSKFAVLRLRFYGIDSGNHCVLSLKSKPVISAGISRAEEAEEAFDPAIGRACIAEPWRLLSLDSSSSRILQRVKEEFGIGDGKGRLACLGGFRNVRTVYDWKGLKLELDETQFDFGTSYEIECESSDPDSAKKLLQEFLDRNGIRYSYSEASKFAVFRSGKLPDQAQ